MTALNSYIETFVAPKKHSLVTTSWDDGHPLDFKLAELLVKYNLKGTFYIPKSNVEHEVMPEASIQELSKYFEIGGHTLSHVAVHEVSATAWKQEVQNCYRWLSDVLEQPPVSFCFPKGQISTTAAKDVFESGFLLARTTELLNINTSNKFILPTTVQVYEHTRSTYVKHLLKRRKFSSLLTWLSTHAERDIEELTEKYLAKAIEAKGCLHLWGHSWEIEENGLWHKLELICKRISGNTDIHYIENKGLYNPILN